MVKPATDLEPGFKMTELGPLPEEWEVVELGDLAKDTYGGGTPSTKEKEWWDGDIPWTTTAIIGEKDTFLRRFQRGITQEGLKHSSTKIVPEGCVLIGTRVGVGKAVVTTFDVAINQDITGFIPKSEVEPEFLVLYIKTPPIQRWFENNKRGATIKGVPRKDVLTLPIPLPPLPEQRAIAHVLRTVQRSREVTEAIIEAAKKLKRSLMRHLFTYGPVPVDQAEQVKLKDTEIGPVPEKWEVVKLRDVILKTKQVNPTKTPEWEFKYVDVSSVSRDSLRIENFTFYRGKDAPSRARKSIMETDVIFATVRPYLKRVAYVPSEFDGHICSTAFCVLRPNPDYVNSSYLFAATSTDSFVNRVSEHQRGSSYPAISDNDVRDEMIPHPPLPEQRKIAEILSTVDRKIETEQARKAALDNLFATLLTNLMTGKIRVKPEEK